jgi:hypothetical protein
MTGGLRNPWQNPRVLLLLSLVFLTGGIVGAVSMQYGLHQTLHHSGPYWKEGGKEISLQRFRKDLILTPQQASEIEGVLDDFMMYYQTLQAQMDDVRASGKSRILRILNDDQKLKFERMMGELQTKQLK